MIQIGPEEVMMLGLYADFQPSIRKKHILVRATFATALGNPGVLPAEDDKPIFYYFIEYKTCRNLGPERMVQTLYRQRYLLCSSLRFSYLKSMKDCKVVIESTKNINPHMAIFQDLWAPAMAVSSDMTGYIFSIQRRDV